MQTSHEFLTELVAAAREMADKYATLLADLSPTIAETPAGVTELMATRFGASQASLYHQYAAKALVALDEGRIGGASMFLRGAALKARETGIAFDDASWIDIADDTVRAASTLQQEADPNPGALQQSAIDSVMQHIVKDAVASMGRDGLHVIADVINRTDTGAQVVVTIQEVIVTYDLSLAPNGEAQWQTVRQELDKE